MQSKELLTHFAAGLGAARLHEHRAIAYVNVKQVDLAVPRHRVPGAVQNDVRVVQPARVR